MSVSYESMLLIMNAYLQDLDRLYPFKAEPMFPDADGDFHTVEWLRRAFKEAWSKVSEERCTSYALRHAYVIENIYSWMGDNEVLGKKLLALSKSLGHTTMAMTCHYFSLVPGIGKELPADVAYANLIPEIKLWPGE